MNTGDPVNADIEPVDDVASDLTGVPDPSILILVDRSFNILVYCALMMDVSHSTVIKIPLYL